MRFSLFSNLTKRMAEDIMHSPSAEALLKTLELDEEHLLDEFDYDEKQLIRFLAGQNLVDIYRNDAGLLSAKPMKANPFVRVLSFGSAT